MGERDKTGWVRANGLFARTQPVLSRSLAARTLAC
jgi:hypothetical protein